MQFLRQLQFPQKWWTWRAYRTHKTSWNVFVLKLHFVASRRLALSKEVNRIMNPSNSETKIDWNPTSWQIQATPLANGMFSIAGGSWFTSEPYQQQVAVCDSISKMAGLYNGYQTSLVDYPKKLAPMTSSSPRISLKISWNEIDILV